MKALLAKTLYSLGAEKSQFDKSFDLIDELLRTYGELNLADRLYVDIDTTIKWQVVVDLFAILGWSSAGNNIHSTIE